MFSFLVCSQILCSCEFCAFRYEFSVLTFEFSVFILVYSTRSFAFSSLRPEFSCLRFVFSARINSNFVSFVHVLVTQKIRVYGILFGVFALVTAGVGVNGVCFAAVTCRSFVAARSPEGDGVCEMA